MIRPGSERDEVVSQLWSQVGQKVDDSLEVEAEGPELLLIHVLGGDLVIDAATDGNLEVGLVNLEDWFRFKRVERTLTKSGLLTGGDET